MTDKMREAFEKWYMTNTFAHVDHLSVFYNDLNCYPTPIANHCWKAWQAAQSEQSAELERLRDALEIAFQHIDKTTHCNDWATVAAAIAAEGEKK